MTGSKDCQFLVGSQEIVDGMKDARRLHPFDDDVISFLDDLSALLRKNRKYSDVATFGFWCRKAALLKAKAQYDDLHSRFGRGTVFHIAPSNVPVNFAFSFASGLLAGNANIVRLSRKPFDQVSVICDAVNGLLAEKHQNMKPYIAFVRYPPERALTDRFSALCSLRVIWGGDETVDRLRQSRIPAKATEITFPDRYSIAVINADAYLAEENKHAVIQGFYNDTYFTDQNACTSPRMVFWLGERKREAKADFWNRVHELVKTQYTLSPVQAVGKLNAVYLAAAQKEVRLVSSEDMLVTRLEPVNSCGIDQDLMKYQYHSGFFFEQDIDSLMEIVGVCGAKCQTLTYFGVKKDEFRAFLEEARPAGIDRVVPVGKSMDFSLVWDGYDLIRQMSGKVSVI